MNVTRTVGLVLLSLAASSTLATAEGPHGMQPGQPPAAGSPVAVVEETQITPPGTCTPEWVHSYEGPSGPTYVAAHYFPWYTERGVTSCPAQPGQNDPDWCRCYLGAKPGQPKPAIGFYYSDHDETVAAHLQAMKQHGINVVAIEWTNEAHINNATLNYVIPAIESMNDMWFVILYDADIVLTEFGFNFDNPDTRTLVKNNLTGFATSTNYFRHPKYLKLDGKPVLYFYVSRKITGDPANVQSVFNDFRAAVLPFFPAGPYLVADHLWWVNPPYQYLQAMGATAVSAFGPVTDGPVFPGEYPDGKMPQTANEQPVRKWADQMANRLYAGAASALPALGRYDIQPGIFVQYDDKGWGFPTNGDYCKSLPQEQRVVQRYHLSHIDD